MRTVLVAVLLALGITTLPAMGADEHSDAHGKDQSTEGTVKLHHDPIPSLKWSKMTMDFKAHDPAMLALVKPGMQVDFELMKMGGGYHVMKISPSPK